MSYEGGEVKWLKVSAYQGGLLVEEGIYNVEFMDESDYLDSLQEVRRSHERSGLSVVITELTERQWLAEEFELILALPKWEEVEDEDFPERIGEN